MFACPTFALPVSGLPVQFRPPRGHDDLLLAEGESNAGMHPLRLRVEAVRRLVPPEDEGADWDQIPFADVDAALLALRRRMTGDRLLAEVRCEVCARWCDTELSIDSYLTAKRPKRVPGSNRQSDGWYEWRDLRFRVPSVAAVLESAELARSEADAARELLRSSIGSDSPEVAARVASVLEKIAPTLAGTIRGRCPHCNQAMRAWFDPGAFVLTELQQRSGVVFEQIHLLAHSYGWTEETILAMPARRRARYAARIQRERVTGNW